MLKRLYSHSKWTASDESKLIKLYNEYGPAYGVIRSKLRNRSTLDCQRKVCKINMPQSIPKLHQQMYLDGCEKVGEDWYEFPIEEIGPSQASILRDQIPQFRTRKERKEAGWQEEEDLVLKEAFEMYADDWVKVKRYLPRRTARQCEKRMEKMYADLIS